MPLSDFRGNAWKFTPQRHNPSRCFNCGKPDYQHRHDHVCFPERAPIYEGRVLTFHQVPEGMEGDPVAVVWDDEWEGIKTITSFYYSDVDKPGAVDATPEVRRKAMAYIGCGETKE